MGIKDIGAGATGLDINYTRTKHATGESEEAWRQRGRDRSAVMKVLAEVAEGCTIETVRGTTLYEREEATPADVGGGSNLDRLRRIGVVNVANERQVKTARGEYDLVVGDVAVTSGGTIYDAHQGLNVEELNRAEVSFRRSAQEPKIVLTEAVDGNEVAEMLIKRNLTERARLRDAVVASAKRRLKRAKTSEDGK